MTASLGKITDANKGYHLGEIEDRLDPYYLKDRSVRTLGRLAPGVGLTAEPTSEQILNVLAGTPPTAPRHCANDPSRPSASTSPSPPARNSPSSTLSATSTSTKRSKPPTTPPSTAPSSSSNQQP